jgi:hypothetical protein
MNENQMQKNPTFKKVFNLCFLISEFYTYIRIAFIYLFECDQII